MPYWENHDAGEYPGIFAVLELCYPYAMIQHAEYTEILHTAEQITREAGELLKTAFYQPRQITFKGEVNLVTQADHAAEELITSKLRHNFPGYSILAEEGRSSDGDNQLKWVIDPLDGTNNFAHGFPIFAVSMCLVDPDGPALSITFDPLRDECFTALKGLGAYLNGARITVSNIPVLMQGLIATGFPYSRHTAVDNNSKAVEVFLRRAQGIRRAGSAALDLAYVAAGRLDGYWEQQLATWDIAAGILLVREAGGNITDYAGHDSTEHLLTGRTVTATNGLIHEEMLATLREIYRFPEGEMPVLK